MKRTGSYPEGSAAGRSSRELKFTELKALWDFYDQDKSDTLSEGEFGQLLDRLRIREGLPDKLPPEFVRNVFNHLNENGNGIIEWNEFSKHFNSFWVNREKWFDQVKREYALDQSALNRSGSAITNIGRASRSAGMTAPQLNMSTKPAARKVKEDTSDQEVPVSELKGLREGYPQNQMESKLDRIKLPGGFLIRDIYELTPNLETEKTTKLLFGEDSEGMGLKGLPGRLGFLYRTCHPRWAGSIQTWTSRKRECIGEFANFSTTASKCSHYDKASNHFCCPHCQQPIGNEVLTKYLSKATGIPALSFEEPSNQSRAGSNNPPLYSPEFNQEMWSKGKIGGCVPPSFFSSSFNTHSWASKIH